MARAQELRTLEAAQMSQARTLWSMERLSGVCGLGRYQRKWIRSAGVMRSAARNMEPIREEKRKVNILCRIVSFMTLNRGETSEYD